MTSSTAAQQTASIRHLASTVPTTETPQTSSKSPDLPPIRRALPNGIQATWPGVDPRIVELIRDAAMNAKWPLVLFGQVGSGKSCAAALVYASWPGRNVKWFCASEIVRLIQTARREGSVRVPGSQQVIGEDGLWRVRVDQPGLLVLDDLGTRKPTESQYEIIFELIDRRKGKPLVVSTNHSPEALGKVFDDRIASRLSAGTVIDFPLLDRRKETGSRYRVR